MPDTILPDQADGRQPDPRLAELARERRLWAIERADGLTDLFASVERIPTSTADLRPVATVTGRLDGLVLVASHTAGAFLVVDVDDHGDEVETIAAGGLRATPAEPAPVAGGTDPRLVTVAAGCQALRVGLDRVEATVALLDRATQVVMARHTVRMRVELDALEVEVERAGAGL